MYEGERFNTVSAAIGLVAVLAGVTVLVMLAVRQGNPWKITSLSVYGVTLFLSYLGATLYHATSGKHKALLRRLDRLAIYLLIAGTYTPFTLITLRGTVGWTIFGIIWALAIVGVLLDTSRHVRRGMWPVVVYLAMGWLCVAAIKPLLHALPLPGFLCLLAGGLFYTIGVVFFVLGRRVRHSHGIWHLFVMAGSVSHYMAIIVYLL